MAILLGLDIGSNSVGSAWIDTGKGPIRTGVSVFPAGVDESDEKRGEPRNAKRRAARRARVTLARRAERKRALRSKLISSGLLPADETAFKRLLESTNPWDLRRRGLDEPLAPHEFGRVLLHLAQRRGALGLRIAETEEVASAEEAENAKVKTAISAVCAKMRDKNARTFGEFVAMVQAERITPITATRDRRPSDRQKGPREYRDAIRNRAENYEHCADREMIRREFATLWDAQKEFGGPMAAILTDELRIALDDEKGDSLWQHRGLLFGQRRASWDLGTLGRCVLEPTDRCVPHADMYASRYLMIETVNNLRVVERGKEPRPLTATERTRIIGYLSGPLGVVASGKQKGQPKRSVTVSDLRKRMGWGRAGKASPFRFNIESDEERTINTDWFSREIIHGALTPKLWESLSEKVQGEINRAILRFDPDDESATGKLKAGVMKWGGLTEGQAEALVAAWQRRPRPDAKRLKMSRRAVRNLLSLMDPPDTNGDTDGWMTQIEARKRIAEDPSFRDATTGMPLDARTRDRYATGARGATARDRHFVRKHLLHKNNQPIFGPDGVPLHEPPPAPMLTNPVVRKAIHEVRRHIIEYMTTFERKPDYVYVELAREAKMGKKDADRLLFRNRLQNRIRKDIISTFELDTSSSTQQRAAVERVILCVQQGGRCPLCGKEGLTDRMAAMGEGCEIAHIIPRACGGHNGLGNKVLAHTECNRNMARRTPRQFWSASLPGEFEEGMEFVEHIYGHIERPKASEVKAASGKSLWSTYFTKRDDSAKIDQFKKDVKDVQGMTLPQEAATKYASRQVMAYLADALYDGKGLPERGGERRIFNTDGMWTSRLRREWNLFFDPHGFKAKGLNPQDENQRKQKDRGDHRHHAIDAVIIALSSPEVRLAWDERETQAEKDGVNTADEVAIKNYRQLHPLGPPSPYETCAEFREAVRCSVFGDAEVGKPICHRPVKRKIIGALHEGTLLGPVLDRSGRLTDYYKARKSVLDLQPAHLRLPRPETTKEAMDRLTTRRKQVKGVDEKTARKWARAVVSSPGYKPAVVDPPPEKSGIVRDVALRRRIRDCLSSYRCSKRSQSGEPTGESWFIDPDNFTKNEIKQAFEAGALCHLSGVPIRSVVLLRTMKDPVITSRWASEYRTGKRYRVYDASTGGGDAKAARAYVGGNNHHIEIRVTQNAKGQQVWSGKIVTTHTAARIKATRLQAFREAGIPPLAELRELPKSQRSRFAPAIRAVENAHPLVDRSENPEEGGRFVMSLCEGETLLMKHKHTEQVGYFVVAKLDKPNKVVLVPHWDARPAKERKDSEGNKVRNSKRDQVTVTPGDLAKLAPADHPHAVKVRVSRLGEVTILNRD